MSPREPFSSRDWRFVAICLLIAAACLFVISRYFTSAFPEASIEMKYDREASRAIGERLLSAQKLPAGGMKHTAVFDSDSTARIFLERTLGLEKANGVMRRDVRLWYWHHRWFRPSQEEEYSVDVAPTGEIVAFARKIPEAKALPSMSAEAARDRAREFLLRAGVATADLQLVSESERTLPHRLQRIYTWESTRIRPAGAPYRYVVTVDGDAVSSFGVMLKVPEEWQRQYADLRSKNNAAGNVDLVFMIITMVAAVAVFIGRIRRGDLHIRFAVTIGIVAVVLVLGVALNSFPAALAGYTTTSSYPAFLAQFFFGSLLQSFGTAMLLVVLCGAGEVLYRERLPQHLAIPKLWSRKSLSSRRVFRSLILGYTLVGVFMAYQTIFYIVAQHYGAWSPADIPYDDILNSSLPWVAVLFAGFFPALSEEFMSRAFSIPFFQRFVRSRFLAIVIAGFIWGFGHATYPNQPFYIRGVEVGLAGVALGLLMDRFGLLPLLIWHYTVDAVYTALLLMRSGNTYYVISGALASLVFAIPLIVSVALLIRNRGFVPDDELSNATLPAAPPPPVDAVPVAFAELPSTAPVRAGIAGVGIAVVLGIAATFIPVPSLDDAVDYRITRGEAKQIATEHLKLRGESMRGMVVADPVSGFRAWNASSPHEDGGSPGGFDSAAAEYLLRSGMSVQRLAGVMRDEIPAATWIVRFFAPQQKREYFVEVDPRTSHVVGYHKYEDEKAPGEHLEQQQALSIAVHELRRFNLDPALFALQDALSYQQPARRDWLFHFQQKQPLAGEGFRRISVRVMGDEVTQFTSTIKIPDAVYRQANEQTLLNTVLALVKLVAGILALGLVIGGFIIAARKGRIAWRTATLLTAIFAVIPVISALSGFESALFGYSTSIDWKTFRLDYVTDSVRNVGLQIGLLFLSFAAIVTVVPSATKLVRRPGRARFGRSAVLATLGAIGVLAAVRPLVRLLVRIHPEWAAVSPVDASSTVAILLPSVVVIAESLFTAIIGSAAVALFAAAISPMRRKRWLPAAFTLFILFAMTLDPGATKLQMPLMLLRAVVMAALGWLVATRFLGRNPLAWPAAIFTGVAVQRALEMLHNHRADLQFHGMITLAATTALLAWLAVTAERTDELVESTAASATREDR